MWLLNQKDLLRILSILAVLVLLWPLIAKAMTTDDEGFIIETAPVHTIALVPTHDWATTTPPEAPKLPRTHSLPPQPTSAIAEQILAVFPDAPIMLRVAQAESQLYPQAKNPHSTAKGIFQILDGTWQAYGCTGNPYNATDNINCARKLYDAEGTRPWNSSKSHWQ